MLQINVCVFFATTFNQQERRTFGALDGVFPQNLSRHVQDGPLRMETVMTSPRLTEREEWVFMFERIAALEWNSLLLW